MGDQPVDAEGKIRIAQDSREWESHNCNEDQRW